MSKSKSEKPKVSKQEMVASEFEERVIFVNRCSKTVKGGRRLSFSALVVAGKVNDKDRLAPRIGIGFAKAKEPADAIRKASRKAKSERNLKTITLAKVGDSSSTIPHKGSAKEGGSAVFLKPAREGTGIVAGPVPRMIAEVIGIDDVLINLEGSNNRCNQAYAMIDALASLRRKQDMLKMREVEQNG